MQYELRILHLGMADMKIVTNEIENPKILLMILVLPNILTWSFEILILILHARLLAESLFLSYLNVDLFTSPFLIHYQIAGLIECKTYTIRRRLDGRCTVETLVQVTIAFAMLSLPAKFV